MIGLLVTLTGAYADNGSLAIANVRNAIPGLTGSLDIVLIGSSTTYRDFQFDITLPSGVTYDNNLAGTLLNGHTIVNSDQVSNTVRLTGHSSQTLQGNEGILLTINFTVGGSATLGDHTVTLSNATFSDDAATHYSLTGGDNTMTIVNTLTLTEDDIAAPSTVSGVDVTLSRSFDVGKWYTICLPFALSADKVQAAFGTNVKVGDFNGYTVNGSGISVDFTTVTDMAANHPYIIKVTDAAVANPTFSSVDIVAGTPMNNKGDEENIKAMIGVYVETTLEENRLYIKDNQFKYSDGTSKLKPYRAYFHFCDFTNTMRSRSITIGGGGATSIQFIEGDSHQNDIWYDLSGRKLSGHPTTKGIYIQNGKKIFIK